MQENFIYKWLIALTANVPDFPEWLVVVFSVLLSLALIAVATPLAVMLINKGVRHAVRMRVKRKEKTGRARDVAKLRTIESILHSCIKYVVYFLALVAFLSVLGLGGVVASLVAAAGVGGLAISFGAQSLIKDVITGLFITFEDQYAVGDYVVIQGIEGTVENMQIRVTEIRGLAGELNIIPNGSIVNVVNHSRGNSVAIVYVDADYQQDIQKVLDSARAACAAFGKKDPDVVRPPVVLGINSIANGIVTVKITCEVKSLTQWDAERHLRQYIKEQFQRDGIQPPIQRSRFMKVEGGA